MNMHTRTRTHARTHTVTQCKYYLLGSYLVSIILVITCFVVPIIANTYDLIWAYIFLVDKICLSVK